MKELFKGMGAEFIKMKHTFLYPLHIALPVMASMIFVLYYRVSGWNEIAQISGYIQVIGVALPFVVSIVCAGNVELEEGNHFQVFLGTFFYKGSSFLAKFLTLFGIGSAAVSAAIFLFAAGYQGILKKGGISFETYGLLALMLCLGSIPLYLEHLFLNMKFTKQVSFCAGAAQFLLSSLFLTGLGDGKWPFFPCSWSARGSASMLLNYAVQKEKRDFMMAEMEYTVIVCLLLTTIICVIIGIWIHFYEGRHYND